MCKIKYVMALLYAAIILSGCNNQRTESARQNQPTGTIQQALTASIEYWVASESEKVPRGAIPSWLTTTNRQVWDGTNIKVFGARNEVVGFQLILRSDQSVTAMDMTVSALSDGSHQIANDPGATDPTSSVGRPIQRFAQRYLTIERASGGPWGALFWSNAAAPTGFATKEVPDPLVPFEVNTANTGHPFSLQANQLQGLWVDVYIPKGTPAGAYTGQVTISENGNVAHTIPITLQVKCFTLPDTSTAKTMLYMDMPEVYWRHGTQEGTAQADTLRKRYYQMLHRHRVAAFESIDTTQLAATRLNLLNGSAFSNAEGYAGPGEGSGTGIFSISTYGAWYAAGYSDTLRKQKADEWANWFALHSPLTERFLYVLDEPDSSTLTANNILNFCLPLRDHTGPGAQLPRMITADYKPGFAVGIDLWVTGAKTYGLSTTKQACQMSQQAWIYNGYRPSTGTFVMDDVGVSPRVNGWVQYKHGIPRWFYWMGNYWSDWQGGRGRLDPYVTAENFRNAWGEWGVGDGILLYPGEQPATFATNDLNFAGAIASIRLKNWRRGIQDADYLALATSVDPTATAQIMQGMLPTSTDAADHQAPVSWNERGDAWEVARKQLAALIEATCTGGGPGPGAPTPPPGNTSPPVCVQPAITAADGPWSAPGTWKDGQVPGAGSAAIIAHNVTVDTDTTIGTTPTDNTHEDVVVLGPTGSLTVAANQRFTVKGNLFLSQSTLTLQEGAIYEFDVPAGKQYQLKISRGDEQNSMLVSNGTALNRVQMLSKAGGGIGQLTGGQTYTGSSDGGWRNGGQIMAYYTDFTRIGDATHAAHARYPGSLSTSKYIFHHCIMDSCGDWHSTAFDGALADIEFKHTTFRNSLANRSLHLSHWGNAPEGSRLIQGCVFDKEVQFFTGAHYQIKDNYFARAFVMTPGVPAAFAGNLIRKVTGFALGIPAAGLEIKDNYWLNDTTTSYAQFVTPTGEGSTDTPTRFQGNVFESVSTDSWGGGIIFNNYPSTTGTVEIEQNIMLPNAVGKSAGALLMLQGSANLSVSIKRNTYMIDALGIFVGLGYLGHSGMISAFRNNLAWAPYASGANFAIYNLGSSWTATDIVDASQLNFNNNYLNQPGSNGSGYHLLTFSSGIPGENDLHVNPQFVDSSRNLAAWGIILGSTGSSPQEHQQYALSALADQNHPTANPDATIANLLAYVRAGFAPTNPALSNAGAPTDGSPDIGAVDVVE